jgi:hypothetical protein
VQALGKYGKTNAFDEFKKNLLATHAQIYPDVFFGVTSGTDVWNSVLSPWPGSTRCKYQSPEGLDGHPASGGCNELAFGLLNSWQHSVPLWNLGAIVGLEWDQHGMQLVPAAMPQAHFTIATSLWGLSRHGPACAYSGWWRPNAAVTNATAADASSNNVDGGDGSNELVHIRVRLTEAERVQWRGATVNGAEVRNLTVSASSSVVLTGTLPLVWSLAGRG